MMTPVIEEFISFIKKSPSCFHAVETMKDMLSAEGFQELKESEIWQLEQGKKFYVIRNGSSMLAFKVGEVLDNYGFNIVASHSDSPTFKVKENPEIQLNGKYIQLNTEGYGGMIHSSWFDRPLSVAGRVVVKKDNQFKTFLIDVNQDLLMIPNVAIHMNHDINNGYHYNLQTDLLPLFSGSSAKKGSFKTLIAATAKVDEENIYGSDLYLYNRMEPVVWGVNKEFISAPRLDDLECAFTSLKGFIKGTNKQCINVFVCFDNEEVGSTTKQGAGSTFLQDILKRINFSLHKTEEDYQRAIAASFMLSADNAHALHPNHPEKSDQENSVYMNEGIVVKYNANQRYTTDAYSSALVKEYCKLADVPVQHYTNRSDIAGGSTLGNVSSTNVSLNAVDIGLAQLAMHSAYESAGVKDIAYMIKLVETFYNIKLI